jgi:hypothetical protein
VKIAKAIEIAGTLSSPSKMPGHGYSTPARLCKTGALLRGEKGTVCNGCYAFRGNYPFPEVQKALYKRFVGMLHPQWVEAMVAMIKGKKDKHFRWFDSGDLQSVDDIRKIVEVARNIPECKFWLPTKEYSFVAEYIKSGGKIPRNLTIRLSAYIIDGPPPAILAKRLGVTTSTVVTHAAKGEFVCPSSKQGNKCLDCRACWSKKTNVAYLKH